MMIEAYNDRLIDQHSAMRHQTYLLMLPNLKQGTNQQKFNQDFWRLPGEEGKILTESLKEKYERLKNGNKRNGDQSRG